MITIEESFFSKELHALVHVIFFRKQTYEYLALEVLLGHKLNLCLGLRVLLLGIIVF